MLKSFDHILADFPSPLSGLILLHGLFLQGRKEIVKNWNIYKKMQW